MISREISWFLECWCSEKYLRQNNALKGSRCDTWLVNSGDGFNGFRFESTGRVSLHLASFPTSFCGVPTYGTICSDHMVYIVSEHDDVIKWKHFPRYWPFVRVIYRSPVNSPHKGQWRRALMYSLICVWINGWVNNREAGDLRRHRTHYDVIVMN